MRVRAAIASGLLFGVGFCAGGCSDPEFDAATPEAALNSIHEMVATGRADLLTTLVHIESRDITYEDGVTEAGAIQDVLDKAGAMLGQLFRVAAKLRDRFPNEIHKEIPPADDMRVQSAAMERMLRELLVNPLGLLDEQAARLSVEDLGDGTAAILVDGKPALGGVGLLMREIDGRWKVDVPIALLDDLRPTTRHEWSVLASMMLSIENSLNEFETELDGSRFRSLDHAAQRAGRLLGESAIIQSLIYRAMKRNAPEDSETENHNRE